MKEWNFKSKKFCKNFNRFGKCQTTCFTGLDIAHWFDVLRGVLFSKSRRTFLEFAQFMQSVAYSYFFFYKEDCRKR